MVFGGMMAGLAGAYLSLVYTPGWKENMAGRQGWIAIAMVIFSTWKPVRALLGALIFGGLNALQFYFQATGLELIPAYILRLLPYLLTLFILFTATAMGEKLQTPRRLHSANRFTGKTELSPPRGHLQNK